MKGDPRGAALSALPGAHHSAAAVTAHEVPGRDQAWCGVEKSKGKRRASRGLLRDASVSNSNAASRMAPLGLLRAHMSCGHRERRPGASLTRGEFALYRKPHRNFGCFSLGGCDRNLLFRKHWFSGKIKEQ